MTVTMAENQNRNLRRSEKMQLEHDMGAFYMNDIATLPTGARGDAARKFMSELIDTKA
jgi:hypothetical protein